MKVISTNIATPKLVDWKGKQIKTGIFKQPTDFIFLGATDVQNDAVIDRKYHGGVDKACYLYSADYYAYWQQKYPELEWNYGMFGENITIEGLDETKLFIGSQYKIGDAIVEITSPREPCFKLGIRFNNQQIIKQFIKVPYCGSYVKVLQEGKVTNGDLVVLIINGKGESIAENYLNRYKS